MSGWTEPVTYSDQPWSVAEMNERHPEHGGSTCVLGCDPGGTTGFFLGEWEGRKLIHYGAWQVDMNGAPELAGWILSSVQVDVMGIEAFDSRLRGRQLKGFSPAAQHRLIRDLEAVAASRGIRRVTWTPGTVKPWAADTRLEKAGLLEATAGMPRHARDAARVALYAGCRLLGLPDPLSRRGASDAARPGR